MTTPEFQNLLTSIEGTVATIKINRPQQMNALNLATLEELQKAFHLFGSHKDVRVLILTGNGDRAFVAGADITSMSEMGPSESLRFAEVGHDTMNTIESCPRPVIAAVNGFCLGGGMELALACDFIYAAENAKLGLPEVGLGLFPGWGGTQRLTRLVGNAKAKEVIFSGRLYTAKEAYELAIVNRVTPEGGAFTAASQTALEIASRGPVAVGIAKRLINRTSQVTLEEGLEGEKTAFPECFKTEDLKEGLKAFLEKRKPSFRGK